MSKPYRPILPPKAGYVEQDGHYVKIPTEQDEIIKDQLAALTLAVAELYDATLIQNGLKTLDDVPATLLTEGEKLQAKM